MKKIFSKALPHVIAIVLYLILAYAYFSPLMSGYDLRQGDVDNWRGMSKEVMDYRMMHNEEALWTDSMFGGMPAYQISTEHDNNVFRWFITLFRFGLPGAMGTLFIALLGGYFLGLFLRVRSWVAILIGAAVGFSTINILYLGAGHTAKVMAIAFVAPTLGALIYSLRNRNVWGPVLFALFFGCQIAANHLQMTYYTAILLLVVGMGELLRMAVKKELKLIPIRVGLLLMATSLAILPSASNLMTTYEYSQWTTRGKSELTIVPESKAEVADIEQEGLDGDYILDYNYGVGERWSLLFPNACGGAGGYFKMAAPDEVRKVSKEIRPIVELMDPYWGGQRMSGGAFYFGLVTLVLALLGWIFLKDVLKWPLLVVTLLALALCVKEMTGLNDFFIHHFPMYNKFRDSKMILMLLPVVWGAMAGLTLEAILSTTLFPMEKPKVQWIALAIVPLLFVFLGNASGVIGSFTNENDEDKMINRLTQYEVIKNPNQLSSQEKDLVMKVQDEVIELRKALYAKDGQRAMLVVVGVIIVLIVMLKFPSIAQYLTGFLVLIAVGDQWGVCRRYLDNDKEKGQYVRYMKEEEKYVPIAPSKSDLFILQQETQNNPGWSNTRSEVLAAMNQDEHWKKYRNNEIKEQVAGFAALNLNSDYRVLTLRDPFNNADVSYLHKSIGGYHGAKLKRYQELISFCIQPEMSELIDSLRKGAPATDHLGVLNMLNTKYIQYNPEIPPIVNASANGNAWFVEEVKSVKTGDEEIVAMKEVDTKKTAVVREEFTDVFKGGVNDTSAAVTLKSYSPKEICYTSTSSQEGPVVFSEIYYPEGWICLVDGKEVSTARVNYVLRGAMVPAGSHEIVWKFDPPTWKKGNQISLTGSIVMILLLLGAGWKERSRFFLDGGENDSVNITKNINWK
jgi:hypothetical protein